MLAASLETHQTPMSIRSDTGKGPIVSHRDYLIPDYSFI